MQYKPLKNEKGIKVFFVVSFTVMEQKYKKHELRDHIYTLPDTYIGSIESAQIESYVIDESGNRMVKKFLTIVPGLYKIYDEIIVNALDHCMRLKEEIKAGKTEDVRPVKTIRINIERETGYIEVFNDGDGIDIDKHPEHGVYIPQMIFGELLTSTNYGENIEKLWGGKNGYGSKLTNIFSKEFTIETVDHRRKKIYSQSFTDNMKVVGKPSVKACSKAPYTRVRFLPDYARFGLQGLTDDIYEIFHRRAMDACATSDVSVSVYFNGKKLEIKNFEKYADLFLGGTNKEKPRAYETCGDRWEIVAAPNENGQFEQVSFVNGINTSRGGKHVDYIKAQISKRIAEMVSSKAKKEVKPQHIVDNLFIVMKCLVVNPAFDTQTKDSLTTTSSKFGSKCELSDKFMTALYKSGIADKAISLTEFHQGKKAAKTDGKKTSRILVEKLDDANDAGTKNSADCTLILTEGDSAKALAIAGLSVVGRGRYGVFPLRGKVMNVKDTSATKIADNKEITDLKKILGLQNGKTYTDVSQLRYGHIMLMTDQDNDGSHIKGLVFNVFQTLWPSLFKMDGFLQSMLTPIIKAIHTNGETVSFYNSYDAEKWRDAKEKSASGLRGWTFKYYKGLGTSTSAEAKEYFTDLKKTYYKYTGKVSDDKMELGFNKKLADDRKQWLMAYDPSNVLDYSKSIVPYEDFVDKDLIHYSNRDLERSLNHVCDGLKESTRKIMFAAFKRKLYTKEIKVAQFGAYTAEVSAYHHGEQSLMQAIVGMAQNFVGSNNINLFKPNGQFGTRIKGGSDASQPRYIFTMLSDLARVIYPEEDFKILDYIEDDGDIVEPKYYIPVIPMILVNGGLGIGTGFSITLPCYNPTEIIQYCMRIANVLQEANIESRDSLVDAERLIDEMLMQELMPWYLGFKGNIVKGKEGTYISHGIHRWINDETVEITELPIGVWTDDYKDFLTQEVVNNNPVLKDFESHYTEKNVKFILKLHPGVRPGIEHNFASEFKLTSSKNLNINNINLYSPKGAVSKYANTVAVIKEYAKVRITKYYERKQYQLKTMRKAHQIIAAKVRFIKQYIEGVIILVGKKIGEVDAQLKALKYPTATEEVEESDEAPLVTEIVAPSYDYLTDMSLKTLTVERKAALEKQEHELRMKIKALEEKSLPDIWSDELKKVAEKWEEYKNAIEKEYETDKSGIASGSGTGKGRRARK
jgi:DNA topoisomerase-2